MRIAFMHRSLSGGGTEADLCRMATGLTARGHEVHVFCARPGTAPAGVAVHRVPVVRAGRVARLLSFAIAAPRAVARERWDVVVGFGRTLRQDVVRVGGGTHRTYLARMEAAGLRRRVRGPYHRAILWIEGRQFAPDGHRRVLAVSARAGAEVTADYGVPADRIAVVYNGVDLDRFHPANRTTLGPAIRRELGIPVGRPICAAIGTGFERKGFDILLALWRDRAPRDSILVLVGDDERIGAFRRETERAPLAGRAIVTGPRRDVAAILAAADAVCVPSRQEAFGNVVLEACAAGVPVVTSRLAGAAELLDGPLAELVVEDPEDRPALFAAIERALGAGRETFAHAARRLAESLPWEAHVARVETELQRAAHAG
jgi:UDP-glucose:(heptosyl)LPS alpha-1,3-glucosyltransferase